MTVEEILAQAEEMSTADFVANAEGTTELLETLTPILSSVSPAAVFTALAVMLGGNLADAMMQDTAMMMTVEDRIRFFGIIARKCYEDSYRFASDMGAGPRSQ